MPPPRPRIQSVYEVDDIGEALLYAGPLQLALGERNETDARQPDERKVLELVGDLVLDLDDRTSLRARLAGPLDRPAMSLQAEGAEVVALGPGADLDPPASSAISERSGAAWFIHTESVAMLEHGDPRSCDRFLIHVSGALTTNPNLPRVECDDGTLQGQLPFALPGWDLTLAALPGERGEARFTHVIEAVPATPPGDVDALLASLYHLLGFVAGREVGLGATCGLVGDTITWVHWSSSKQRPGRPGICWCAPDQVATALPSLAAGVGRVEADPYMRHVYRRALGYLQAAGGDEVLDVKIPLACAGLELLAWGVLQDEGWARAELLGTRALPAAATARLMLRSMEIPTDIPPHLKHITARARTTGSDCAGPEVIFQIRNALIHPPKGALSAFKVPHHLELWDAWLLSTCYLELALLHLLGHHGPYWNRLQLGRYENDVEPVPWAPTASPVDDAL